MQNPRLRNVYRQGKWPLLAPMRKIIALERKIMALACQVFHYTLKCSKPGLRGFIDAVQHRLATRTVTMLTSCWQVLSEVDLQRIFDFCKRWANSSFACICIQIYFDTWGHTGDSLTDRVKERHLKSGFVLHFHTCSARTARFGRLYRNILISNMAAIILFQMKQWRWGRLSQISRGKLLQVMCVGARACMCVCVCVLLHNSHVHHTSP